jgi:hypothetical protein
VALSVPILDISNFQALNINSLQYSMSSNNSNGRGVRAGGHQESSKGRGGRGHTGRGRGSHQSSQLANISQVPRSGVDSIPRLTYGLNSNFTLWLERITVHAVLTYDSNAMFFYTGVYIEYPMIQLGVGL